MTGMFAVLLRTVFGLVFIYAGAIKIPDPGAFTVAVANYQILPPWLVNPAAVFIPWIEVVCGAALVLGVFARGAALVLNGMLAGFTAAVAYNWQRGLDIECGCFGDVGGLSSTMAAATARDAGLLVVGLVVLWALCARPGQRVRYK